MNQYEENESADGVSVTIEIDHIYQGNTARFTFTAAKPYSIFLSGMIVAITQGTQKTTRGIRQLEPVLKDQAYQLSVECVGWFTERRVFDANGLNYEANRYGMQYYPFISSCLSGTITIYAQPIHLLAVKVPDLFRILWHGTQLTCPKKIYANILHSYAPDKSQYILSWDTAPKEEGDYTIKIPIKVGGISMMRMTEYPVFYWIFSLLLIAAAGYQGVPQGLSVMGLTLTFLLAHWSSCPLPQRNTMLLHAYLYASVFNTVWAFAWIFFHWWALFLVIIATPMASTALSVTHYFQSLGELPEWLARLWHDRLLARNPAQKKTHENAHFDSSLESTSRTSPTRE